MDARFVSGARKGLARVVDMSDELLYVFWGR